MDHPKTMLIVNDQEIKIMVIVTDQLIITLIIYLHHTQYRLQATGGFLNVSMRTTVRFPHLISLLDSTGAIATLKRILKIKHMNTFGEL